MDQYDATSAGIVLTPRAIVIVVMAPLVVPAHTHRRSKQLILLIFLGCFALVVAVWHLNQLSLDADYWVFARARCASRIWVGISHRPNYPGCLMHAGYSAIETANGAEARLYSALN